MNAINKTIFSVPNSSELEQLTELHKAMGDYTRMKILWYLMKQEYCVSDLAKKIKVTESAISHQLHELRIARLVRSRKDGKKVFYSIQDEHIQWILEETYAHISERYP
jgi:ArsR family transcriptional regulator